MKKIIACIALSILSLVFTIGSFLSNDMTAYRNWAMQHYPQIEQKLNRHMPGFWPGRRGPEPRQDSPQQGPGRDDQPGHHKEDRRGQPTRPDRGRSPSRLVPDRQAPPAESSGSAGNSQAENPQMDTH